MTFGLGRSPEQEGKGKEPRSLKKDSMMLSRCYCISLNTRGPVLHRLVVDLRSWRHYITIMTSCSSWNPKPKVACLETLSNNIQGWVCKFRSETLKTCNGLSFMHWGTSAIPLVCKLALVLPLQQNWEFQNPNLLVRKRKACRRFVWSFSYKVQLWVWLWSCWSLDRLICNSICYYWSWLHGANCCRPKSLCLCFESYWASLLNPYIERDQLWVTWPRFLSVLSY